MKFKNYKVILCNHKTKTIGGFYIHRNTQELMVDNFYYYGNDLGLNVIGNIKTFEELLTRYSYCLILKKDI